MSKSVSFYGNNSFLMICLTGVPGHQLARPFNFLWHNFNFLSWSI